MTKKLEELFNMEDKETALQKQEQTAPVEVTPQQIRSVDDSYKEVSKITSSLPKIQELDHMEEKDLDSLADKAEKAYDDLMDLGMNVEVRYSGRIFEVAGNFLRNAIDAKSGKIDKKLKMIELQLKKQKLDQGNKDDAPIEQSDGYVISDRNELMKKLLKKD